MKTHKLSGTRFYKIWKSLRQRCKNKNYPRFKDYGGRGISICDRWEKFENFKGDMLNGYSDELTIDRIDNNGNYEPNNCRWATVQEQNKNKRMHKLNKEKVLSIREELKEATGKEISEKYGVSRGVISEIKNFGRNYAFIK